MFLVPMSRDSRPLSRLFDDSFERFFGPSASGEGPGLRSPALDLAETDRAYTVKLEVPGVAKEDVFPLDVDRAFAKLDELKPNINVWWTTGDQSQQIFRDEEVVMGIMWDGRAHGLRDQGVDVQLSFEGSPISRDSHSARPVRHF